MEQQKAWITLPGVDEIKASTPEGSKHPYDFGTVMSMSRLSRVHPTIGPAFRELFATIMFGEGQLSRGEREMIAAVTAAAQDCQY